MYIHVVHVQAQRQLRGGPILSGNSPFHLERGGADVLVSVCSFLSATIPQNNFAGQHPQKCIIILLCSVDPRIL